MIEIHTTAAAFVAGLITSLHCAGMCGPIACSVCMGKGSESSQQTSAILYHLGRILIYTTLGTLCGWLGKEPLQWFFDSPAVLLPWAIAFLFLVFSFNLFHYLPASRFGARMRLKACGMSVKRNGFLMGLATPMLPCGPLYLLFGATLLTGSALKGAEFAMAFALGTVPLLWLAQHGWHRLSGRMNPGMLLKLQRGLAFSAAVVMIWRLHGTLPFLQQATPSCH